MTVELFAVLAALGGGAALLRSTGLRGWGLLPWGFLAGCSLEIVLTLLQVAAHIPGGPLVTLALTLGLPLAWWLSRALRGADVRVRAGWAVAAIVGTTGFVAIARVVKQYSWHVDSLEYLTVSSMIAHGHFLASADAYMLDKRLIGIAALHAPAQVDGEQLLVSLTPLIALATLGVIAWLIVQARIASFGRTKALLFAALAIAALVTLNRFDFHAFYINGHLLVAAALVVLASSIWLHTSGRADQARTVMPAGLLAAAALVLTRPEGVMMAGLALVPLVASGVAAREVKVAYIRALGASTAAWFGFVAVMEAGNAEPFTRPAVEALAGALMVVLAPVVASPRWLPWTRRAVGATEAAMWVLVAALSIHDPQIFTKSVHSTSVNAFAVNSAWGVGISGIVALMLVVTPLAKREGLVALRFPVTTFVPLALLLAFARGSAYRVSVADSLDRMLIQVLPLAVLYVVLAATAPAGGEPVPDGAAPDQAAQPRKRAASTAKRIT